MEVGIQCFALVGIVGIHRHSTVFGSLPQTEHLAGRDN